MMGMWGINTDSPLAHPVIIIVASSTFFWTAVTCSLVPLHNLGGQKFRSNIVGIPIFRISLSFGKPTRLSVFRTSNGYYTALSTSKTESTDR